MEWPRTTVASAAGVRAGYGLGIYSTIDLPYQVLGPQRRHRRLPLVVRLLAVARRGLRGAVERHARARGAHAPVVARDPLPEARRRASCQGVDGGAARVAAALRGLLPPAPARSNQVLQALEFPLGGLTVRVDGARARDDARSFDAPRSARVGERRALPARRGADRRRWPLRPSTDRWCWPAAGLYAERRPRWPFDCCARRLGAALGGGLAPVAAAVACGRVAPPSRGPPRPRAGSVRSGRWRVGRARAGGLGGVHRGRRPTLPCPRCARGPLFARPDALSGRWPSPLRVATAAGLDAAAPSGPRAWSALAVMLAHVGLATYLGWWGLARISQLDVLTAQRRAPTPTAPRVLTGQAHEACIP